MLFTNATFAFSINVHVCQGKFQSLSFFGKKATCSKMVASSVEFGSCCDRKKQSDQLTFSSQSCCDNKQFSAASVLEKSSHEQLNVEINSLASNSNLERYSVEFISELALRVAVGDLPPPPIIKLKKRQAVLQVFQI